MVNAGGLVNVLKQRMALQQVQAIQVK